MESRVHAGFGVSKVNDGLQVFKSSIPPFPSWLCIGQYYINPLVSVSSTTLCHMCRCDSFVFQLFLENGRMRVDMHGRSWRGRRDERKECLLRFGGFGVSEAVRTCKQLFWLFVLEFLKSSQEILEASEEISIEKTFLTQRNFFNYI